MKREDNKGSDEDQGRLCWLLKCQGPPFPWDKAHIYVCLTGTRSRIELDELLSHRPERVIPSGLLRGLTPHAGDVSQEPGSHSLLPGGRCDAGSRSTMPLSPKRTVRAETWGQSNNAYVDPDRCRVIARYSAS